MRRQHMRLHADRRQITGEFLSQVLRILRSIGNDAVIRAARVGQNVLQVAVCIHPETNEARVNRELPS